jgi:hypothetical protein
VSTRRIFFFFFFFFSQSVLTCIPQATLLRHCVLEAVWRTKWVLQVVSTLDIRQMRAQKLVTALGCCVALPLLATM